jgi:hypothetical protein
MFEQSSRYFALPVRLYQPASKTNSASTQPVAYAGRRFLPNGDQMMLAGVERVEREDDRLDLVAARALGAPEMFWRICDANNALWPFDLTDTTGRTLRVPSYSQERRV